MKLHPTYLTLPLLFVTTLNAFSQESCLNYPSVPKQLGQPYLSYNDIGGAENAYQQFYSDSLEFLECLDRRVEALDPTAEGYELLFSQHEGLRQEVSISQDLTTDRYNYLLENVRNPDPESSAANSSESSVE